jgi:hypothetical protein
VKGARVPMRVKRAEAPQWIFPWRSLGGRWVASVMSVLLAAGGFLLLFTGVRVRFPASVAMTGPSAVMMQVPEGLEGDALARLAREDGPFPARFRPREWEGHAGLESEALASWGIARRPEPVLVEWEEESPEPVRLSEPGRIELPRRTPLDPLADQRPRDERWTARIGSLDRAVRIMDGGVPDLAGIRMRDEWVADPPRLLVRIGAGGVVAEGLAVGEGAEAAALGSRMRGLGLRTEPRFEGWLPVEVFFGRTSDHGPEPR